jgi:hypothetical protein
VPLTLARRAASAAHRLAECASDAPTLVAELLVWRMALPVLKRTVALATLARLMWTADACRDDRDELARVRSVIDRGGRILTSENCLERSLVLYRLFARAGASPRLILGTKRDGQAAVAGHAWIEISGVPFGEPNAGEYVRLVGFGHGGLPVAVDGRGPA